MEPFLISFSAETFDRYLNRTKVFILKTIAQIIGFFKIMCWFTQLVCLGAEPKNQKSEGQNERMGVPLTSDVVYLFVSVPVVSFLLFI